MAASKASTSREESERAHAAANDLHRAQDATAVLLKAMHAAIHAMHRAALAVLLELGQELPDDGLVSDDVVCGTDSPIVDLLLDRMPDYPEWFRGSSRLRDATASGIWTGWSFHAAASGPRLVVPRTALSLDTIDDALRRSTTLLQIVAQSGRRVREALAIVAANASRPPDKRATWRHQVDDLQKIEALTDDERDAARDALMFLQTEFGEHFLQEALDQKHPLWVHYICGRAQWQKRWLGWFGAAARDAKRCERGEEFLRSLRHRELFEERLSVLYALDALLRAGFRASIDPPVDVDGKRKHPDLLCVDPNGTHLFVEVSRFQQRPSEVRAFDQMVSLWRAVDSGAFCLHLESLQTEEAFDRLLDEVRAMVADAHASNELRCLERHGVVRIAVAPREMHPHVAALAEARGRRLFAVAGPATDIELSSRLEGKLREKLFKKRQIPPGEAGLIVLVDRSMGAGMMEESAVLSSELRRGLVPFPNIVGALLRFEWFGIEPGDVCPPVDEAGVLQVTRSAGAHEFVRTIFVANPACDRADANALVERVRSSILGDRG